MAPYPFITPEADKDVGELTRGWDRTARLSRMKARRRDRDASEAQDLLDLVGWADDHRTDVVESWAGAGLLPGHADHSMPIMMSGVPVDEFCLAELSSALGISQGAARGRTEEALELRERLPRLWACVHGGRLSAWKARDVARQTRSLPDEAADYVDRHLAPFAATLGAGRVKNLLNAAILRFDPDRAAAEAAEASDNRGVWFDFEHGDDGVVLDDSRPDGTMRFQAVASVPDGLAFRDALRTKAGELKILGDEDSEQVRMSKSIGILADSQYALDLSATADAVVEEESSLVEVSRSALVLSLSNGSSTPSPRPTDRRPSRARTPLGVERPIHVHLHTSTQTARIQASGLPHAASPVSREAVERWIADLAPGAKVKVTPVVDLNGHHAVDHYEAPDFIRTLVTERDDACVFPFCTNRGRFDLDHIEEYADPEDPGSGGPPGQTSNRNLAKLCRYHHRAKTHTTWTYKRVDSVFDLDPAGPDRWMPDWLREPGRDPDAGGPPPAHLWTSPIGFTYLVTATGTYPRD